MIDNLADGISLYRSTSIPPREGRSQWAHWGPSSLRRVVAIAGVRLFPDARLLSPCRYQDREYEETLSPCGQPGPETCAPLPFLQPHHHHHHHHHPDNFHRNIHNAVSPPSPPRSPPRPHAYLHHHHPPPRSPADYQSASRPLRPFEHNEHRPHPARHLSSRQDPSDGLEPRSCAADNGGVRGVPRVPVHHQSVR